MKIELINPSFSIIQWPDKLEEILEVAARNCYQSEPRGDPGKFLKSIIALGHESVLEHCVATVMITCSRSCSHQLVRHRLGAYSQESQRYVNYGKKPIAFIKPKQLDSCTECSKRTFLRHLEFSVRDYLDLLEEGWKPEDAREVLPNCTATKIVTTFNMRQWRHVFLERALNKHAQAQIRKIFLELLEEFKTRTCIFDDLMEYI